MPMKTFFNKDVLEALKRVYGDDLNKVLEALTRPNKYYTVRVNTLKTDVDTVLDEFKRMGYKVKKHKEINELILFEYERNEKIDIHENLVYVDKFTAESAMMGANVYAPGVLKIVRGKGDKATVLSINGIPVAEGVLAKNFNESLRKRKGIVVNVEKSLYMLPSFRESDLFLKGYIYPQSLPALVAVRALEPEPNEKILDMCAAPGGKTSYIAQLTKNKAKIIAVDRSRKKVKKLRENLEILGCKAEVIRADSRFLKIKADKVLIDPSCSSLGVRPKIYDLTTYKKIKTLSEYQKQFLKSARRIARKFIVYSTCTLTLEENEEIVEYAEKELNLRLIDFEFKEASQALIEGALRFHPHIQDTTGFFIAKFKV